MEILGMETSTFQPNPAETVPPTQTTDPKCFTHDLTQLLTAILCNVSLAKCTLNSDDKAFRKLTEVEIASLRAKDLIQQFANFGSSQSPSINSLTALEPLVQEAIQSALCGSLIPYFCHFPDDLWPIMANESQIIRVFQNLLLNARQASIDGGLITIQAQNLMIRQKTEDQGPALTPGPYVMVTLEDQGMGIAEDRLHKIFHPHFTTKSRGNGLGLAIAHSIVAQHLGHITVTSELDVGTTFTIYLPAHPLTHSC